MRGGGGSHNKDYSIQGCILGSPSFGKLPVLPGFRGLGFGDYLFRGFGFRLLLILRDPGVARRLGNS